MRKRLCGNILALALAALLGATGGAGAKDSSDEDDLDVFDAQRVWTIHLRVTADQWRMMYPTRQPPPNSVMAEAVPPPSTQPTAPTTRMSVAVARPASRPSGPPPEGQRLPPNPFGYEYAYVRATMEFEGETLNDVGLRFKGNSSYNGSTMSMKRPFKVDFNHFVDGRKFHGLGSLNLNNCAYDPSFVREALSFELFREAGVPAPRTAYALVYLTIDGRCDKEYLGPYLLIEEVDEKPFLKRQFGSSKGLLLKPERVRGLPYLGEDWSAYASRYRPKTDDSEELGRRLIEFIKLVNYADDATFRAQVESFLNVDSFLRFVAAEVLLANLDSPLLGSHNYYLYVNPRDSKLYWMPWDMNLSFAGYLSVGTEQQQTALSVERPYAESARLIDRLFAIPKYNQVYRSHLKQFTETCFHPQRMLARIDAIQKKVTLADEAARAPRKLAPTTMPVGWSSRPAPDVRTFVTRRVESVQMQLAGDAEGYIPAGYGRGGFFNGFSRRRMASGLSMDVLTGMLLRSADVNGDRLLTWAELATAIHSFFIGADADNSGALDEKAMVAGIARLLPPAPAPSTRPSSSDRRSYYSRRESPPLSNSELAGMFAAAIVREADADRDGRVREDDLLTAARRLFLQVDREWDGALSSPEIYDAIGRLPMVDRR